MRRCAERFLRILERAVTAALYPFYLLSERLGRGRLAVLMYHQVGRPLEGVRGGDECVSPHTFETQIRTLLHAGYRATSLRSLLGGRPGASSFIGRQFVVTFDDGYRGQFENALPVLRRYKIPATFFLVAGAVGTGRPLSHLCSDGEERHDGVPEEWRSLGWDQARRLAGEGMTIGSHSLSHRSLGRLEAAEIEDELRRSKAILERGAGARVELFAYPFGSGAYGDFDRGIQGILRRAGYLGACTTVVGRNDAGIDPYALRRIPMEEGDGPFRVRCKLVGAYDWVGPAKSLWQKLVPRRDRVDRPLLLGVE
ncbi:MAG TPA: polysaccharide deacetylase family protein [Candidatus Polarisedimenticolia bacterium]